jgi:hypothetical protein
MIAFVFLDQSFGSKKHPKPIIYEDISVPFVGVAVLTTANVRKCVGALIRFESGPFRERHDGTGAPVSNSAIAIASGYLRSDGDEYFYSREEALRLVVILDTLGLLAATEGMLRVTYYG